MRAKPFKSEVKLKSNSSLRKIMRAFRRDKLQPEQLGIIARALESAAKRQRLYMNAYARRRIA